MEKKIQIIDSMGQAVVEGKTYSLVVKGGRCFNGFHNDRGRVVHFIEGLEPNGYWGGKALCGSETGRRSYGWSLSNNLIVNCQKCVNKLCKIHPEHMQKENLNYESILRK